jgi:hypothetical protein
MVVRMVVKNRRRACLYAHLCSSFRLSLSVTMSRRVMPLSGVPACGVPLCAVPQGVRDVVQVGIGDSACQDSASLLKSLPDDLESELVQARKRGQSAQGKCRQARRAHRPSEACAGVGTPNESAECRRQRQNSVSCSASALPWS